jgi:hypothetical protein
MTPYIGSHDTSRFVTLADYRGQDAAHDKGVPGNQWDNVAVAPRRTSPTAAPASPWPGCSASPARRCSTTATSTASGAARTPTTARCWRPENDLNADEIATLAWVRKLGQARAGSPALRRGAYVPLYADEDSLVFGRKLADGDAAIVALTRATNDIVVDVEVTAALGFAAQSQLHDLLGGQDATVGALGKAKITIPAGAATILAP